MNKLLLFAGGLLLLWGLYHLPARIEGGDGPLVVAPGQEIEALSRRWIALEVPAGVEVSEFLRRQNLTAPHHWFRTSCDPSAPVYQKNDVPAARRLWVAVGDRPTVSCD